MNSIQPRRRRLVSALLAAFILAGSSGAHASLLSNPGFEAVPDGSLGQGLLPGDFFNAGNIALGADTYSHDGSYGLSPGAFGNFVGAMAQDGLRFVAASESSTFNEAFGQTLAVPLSAGTSYTFTAWIRERLGGGGFVSGGYELILSPTTAFDDSGAVSLGFLDPTTGLDEWEFRSLTFVTPANAPSLANFILAPYAATVGEAYIAIDNLSLEPTPVQGVPEPSTLVLASLGVVAGMTRTWRRRQAAGGDQE